MCDTNYTDLGIKMLEEQAGAWMDIYDLCYDLGMMKTSDKTKTAREMVLEYIQKLHDK